MTASLDLSKAVCKDQPMEAFFPSSTDRQVVIATVYRAKAMCSRCPLIEGCLQFAIDNGASGIWGGTTLTERKSFKRSPRSKQIHIDNIKAGKFNATSIDPIEVEED
jgi:WhiB family redox-sensing transcriptional regulator